MFDLNKRNGIKCQKSLKKFSNIIKVRMMGGEEEVVYFCCQSWNDELEEE